MLLFVGVYAFLFLFQEKLIFFPETLEKNYQFSFDQKFEEISILTNDRKVLNGLLFKSDNSKGLVFYLHGNAGSLKRWGKVAKTYTDLQYDVFMLDYRGFGKSEGSISSQEQLFADVQTAYVDEVIYYGSSLKLKKLFNKQDTLITLLGEGHEGMTNNLDYKIELSKVLNRP